MDVCQDPLETLAHAIAQLLDGAHMSLQNALALLQAAEQIEPSAESAASLLASMGAEEIGKAVLLKQRGHWLLYNSQIRLHTLMFADDPDWTDGASRIHELKPWGTFASRRGPFFSHREKLQALREYYQDVHPQVIEATDSKIVLASLTSLLDALLLRSARRSRTLSTSEWPKTGGVLRCRASVASRASSPP
jgi:hypothetical protein